MEQPGKITGRILLAVFLAALAAAFAVHFRSEALSSLGNGKPVYFAVLSKPSMIVRYEPAESKASVYFAGEKPLPGSAGEQAAALAKSFAPEGETPPRKILFLALDSDRDAFCENAKKFLGCWRENPAVFFNYFAGWFRAGRAGNCNVSFPEFLTLTSAFSRLSVGDFTVLAGEPQASAAVSASPLVVEVLNATGKKSVALKVTGYLRSLGSPRVDVLRFDNYREPLAKSKILSHSGRLEEISALASSLGIASAEISSPRRKSKTVDATLILGRDFLAVKGGWQEMLH